MTSLSRSPLRLLLALTVVLLVAAVTAASAGAALTITGFNGSMTEPDGTRNAQAGGHPDFTTEIDVATFENENGTQFPVEDLRDVDVSLPPGLIGNPAGIPTCTTEQLSNNEIDWAAAALCPVDSQVGVVELGLVPFFNFDWAAGIYNIEVPKGAPALFGFNVVGTVVLIEPELRGDDYGLTVHTENASQTIALTSAKITFWGVPALPVHDPQRFFHFVPGKPSGLPPKAFMSMPTSCSGPMEVSMRANSWQDSGNWGTAAFDTEIGGEPFQVEDCDAVPFAPSFGVSVDSSAPDTPVGLDVDLSLPQAGTTEPTGIATGHLKKAVVTLPEGMTINPASVGGLQTCSDAQLGLGVNAATQCPLASKIGSISATTPVLEEPLSGSVYLRPQNSSDPESGELFRIVLVVANAERGVRVKLPGSISADKETGRLVATVDNSPQLPISTVHLDFKGGPRAPLANPSTCGEKTIEAELTSWSGKVVRRSSSFAIQCAPGQGGFSPTFSAGMLNPLGGAYSPFALEVGKPDGDSALAGLRMDLPPGLLANLKGKLGTRVGSVTALAGTGPNPFAFPGVAYLEGPYRGAPYSLRVVIPAKAGPFDLGEVTVRNALRVDPVDAHVTVVSDPFPTIVAGVPVRLQRFEVDVDRPQFTINPTSCAESTVSGALTSATGQTAPVSSRFQVANCANLGFQPKLALGLSGAPTRRGGFPALKATLTMPAGGANIARAAVTLPKTEILEQAHIKTICTRVQYAALACPKGSVYGYARAWSPLLDRPLEGPVYLRSSSHPLPDLVASLDGQIHVDLQGRIDSPNARIRNTFDLVPDAPVSKFVLTMQGGKKGLLANNTDLCRAKPVASAKFDGQNGKVADSNPLVKVAKCGKKGK